MWIIPRFLKNEAEVVEILKKAKRILFSQCCGFPRLLFELILRNHDALRGKELVLGLVYGEKGVRPGQVQSFKLTTWQPSPSLSKMAGGRGLKILPFRYRDLGRHFSPGGCYPVDAVIFQSTPSKRNGKVSLGAGCDYVAPLIGKVPITLAQYNSAVPYTYGDSEIDSALIEYAYPGDQALDDFPPLEADHAIGRNTANLLMAGDAIQVGVGRAPSSVLGFLDNFRGISIYGVFTDDMIELHERGIINGTGPSFKNKKKIVTVQLLGTERLWEYAHENRNFWLKQCGFTHDESLVGRIKQFVSINSALEVDLSGQVNAEVKDGKIIGGVGGQIDFVIGSRMSPGGRSIICLPSLAGDGSSRIVPSVEHVTTPKTLVDYIVTENGVADLRGKSYEERAEEIIGIAAPAHRQWLADHLKAKIRVG